jgi:hypothetical protein
MKKVYTLTGKGRLLINTPNQILNKHSLDLQETLEKLMENPEDPSIINRRVESLYTEDYIEIEEKPILKPRVLVLTDKFIKENTEFENAVTVLEKYDEYAMEKFSEAFMDHNDSDFGETRKFCNMILSNKNEKIGEDEWETGKEYLPFSEDDEDIQSWHGELDEVQPYLNPMIKAGYLKIIG